MEGPGERLCVGEPGRLSLEETEWWRPEEKLRLLCITVLPFDSFFKMLRRLEEEQREGDKCVSVLFHELSHDTDPKVRGVLMVLQSI